MSYQILFFRIVLLATGTNIRPPIFHIVWTKPFKNSPSCVVTPLRPRLFCGRGANFLFQCRRTLFIFYATSIVLRHASSVSDFHLLFWVHFHIWGLKPRDSHIFCFSRESLLKLWTTHPPTVLHSLQASVGLHVFSSLFHDAVHHWKIPPAKIGLWTFHCEQLSGLDLESEARQSHFWPCSI